MDVDLVWASSCHVSASVAAVPVSVRDVYVSATVRLQFAPLLDDYPIGTMSA
jgi:hypothetical protein